MLAARDAKSFDAAATAAVGLIVSAGDGSKLILDPDLDSYYVMDTLITKLPAMADNTGRAGDLQTIVTARATRSTSGSRSRVRRARCARRRPRWRPACRPPSSRPPTPPSSRR